MPWPPDSQDSIAANRIRDWFRHYGPSLRWRKALYLVLAIPSAIIWFPVSVLGLGIFIGAIGVVALPVLVRCIIKLPIEGDPARRYYGSLIFLGELTLGILMAAYLVSGEEVVLPVVLSGIALLTVGCAVMVEMMVPRRISN